MAQSPAERRAAQRAIRQQLRKGTYERGEAGKAFLRGDRKNAIEAYKATMAKVGDLPRADNGPSKYNADDISKRINSKTNGKYDIPTSELWRVSKMNPRDIQNTATRTNPKYITDPDERDYEARKNPYLYH